jgi:hypothetical protein
MVSKVCKTEGARHVTNSMPLSDGHFFWLGRVPSRTVQILGLVVGVQVYEKIYTGESLFSLRS